MMKESIPKTIWRVIYPYMLYFVITFVIQLIMIIPMCIRLFKDVETYAYVDMYSTMMQYIYDHAMLMTLVSGVLTIPIMYLFFCLDKKKYVKNHMIISYESLPIYYYGYVVALGIATCLFLNYVIDVLDLIRWSPIYQEVSQMMYGGNAMLTFFVTVLMAPVLEELLFRGLIYKRLRVQFNPVISAVIASLAFGVTHGNLVQFVYAFAAGMLLCFGYEKFKNLWAPIVFHMCANATSVLLESYIQSIQSFTIKISLAVIELAIMLVVMWIINKNVIRKSKPTMVDREG